MGQRQLQYERYHSGDPVRLASLQYLQSDLEPLRALVRGVVHSSLDQGGRP